MKHDNDLQHRVSIAKQKGEELKLNPVLIKAVPILRKKYGIPLDGFENNVQCMKWQKAELRKCLDEWHEDITKLRLKLDKQSGWQKSLERYLMVNFLVGPLRTVSMSHRFEGKYGTKPVGKTIVILDEPIRYEDVREAYEEDRTFEDIPNKRPRLYNLDVLKLVHELSNTRYGLKDSQIADEINDRFGTNLGYNDISRMRSEYKEKFIPDEM